MCVFLLLLFFYKLQLYVQPEDLPRPLKVVCNEIVIKIKHEVFMLTIKYLLDFGGDENRVMLYRVLLTIVQRSAPI